MLTANLFKLPNIEALDQGHAGGEQGEGRPGDRPSDAAADRQCREHAPPAFSPAQQEQLKEGETVYKTLCFSCHGDDGRGVAMAGAGEGAMMAPPLAGSPRVQGHRDYVINTLLHGMTGPIAGQTYSGQVMLPMGAQNDQWIANIASYVRNSFGNTGVVRHAGGRGAGARREHGPQDAVDLRRARRRRSRGCCRPIRRGRRRPATTPREPAAA